MEERQLRRLQVIGNHVVGDNGASVLLPEAQSAHIGAVPASIAPSNVGASTSYASATGRPSSYARIHGEVSKVPPQWRTVPSVQNYALEEVKYQKSVGEGIAKVRNSSR